MNTLQFETQEEAQEYGISNLKDLAKGILLVADIASDVAEDNKVDFNDFTKILAVPDIVAKLKKAPQALKEAGNLSDDETTDFKAEISAFANELNADLEADKIEIIAAKSLIAAASIANLINEF